MTPAGAPALEALRQWRGLSCCHIFLSDHRSATRDAEGEDTAKSWEFEVITVLVKFSLARQIVGENIYIDSLSLLLFLSAAQGAPSAAETACNHSKPSGELEN